MTIWCRRRNILRFVISTSVEFSLLCVSLQAAVNLRSYRYPKNVGTVFHDRSWSAYRERSTNFLVRMKSSSKGCGEEVLSDKEKFSLARRAPQGRGIRLVCISDTHSKHTTMASLPLPDGEVLIHGGDFSNTGTVSEIRAFVEWFDAQPNAAKIFIAGNHETSIHTEYYLKKGAQYFHPKQKQMEPRVYSEQSRAVCMNAKNSVYLEDSGCRVVVEDREGAVGQQVAVYTGKRPLSTFTSDGNDEGAVLSRVAIKNEESVVIGSDPGNSEKGTGTTTPPTTTVSECTLTSPGAETTSFQERSWDQISFSVYGSPWQPEFCDWAFNLDRGAQIREKWDMIPADVDVLITHGPPQGYGDRCSDGFRCGCVDLLKEIQRRADPPRVHIFGHIHEDPGAWSDGKTLFVNASTCRLDYRPLHPPIVVHLPFNRSLPATILPI